MLGGARRLAREPGQPKRASAGRVEPGAEALRSLVLRHQRDERVPVLPRLVEPVRIALDRDEGEEDLLVAGMAVVRRSQDVERAIGLPGRMERDAQDVREPRSGPEL